MNVKKLMRFTLLSIAIVVGLLILFLAISIVPVDRTVNFDNLLDTMASRIDAVDEIPISSTHGFQIGFGKENLTPPYPTATAGYGKRMGKLYESVHDSIYVRSIVIDNGVERVAIVSADLLIIPPSVTSLLNKELEEVGFTLDNTYLGATHSHNSVGNWGKGAVSILYGSYEDSIVRFIADKIKRSINAATQNMRPSVIKVGSISIPDLVYNRVADGGPVDPLLRAIEVHRDDSTKLVLLSYTAHATCLFSSDLQLSGDYPGRLTQIMESKGYAFSMFMAGAVGSHGPRASEGGWSCIEWMAEKIADNFISQRNQLHPVRDSILEMHRVALDLPALQPKVQKDWRARPWLFRAVFGEYQNFLTVLRIGDLVMLGTPCDFSGEFDSAIDRVGRQYHVIPMVTSFNGTYIGYLTPLKYYDVDHYETQLMSWYGPGNGEYVEKSLEKLLVNVAK